MKKFALATLATACLTATSAFAHGPEPGSLLIYPVYQSTPGVTTVITVTNTNADTSLDPDSGLASGTIDVHFHYIDGDDCQEDDRIERLTPNDTFSALASAHNPSSNSGYLYLYAIDVSTGEPVKFDYLIGNLISIDGIDIFEYGVNPFTFKAGAALAHGAETDLDGDDHQDLDGSEYEEVGDELLQPRFFGQGGAIVSELVLIGLTGTLFSNTIDFLVYNDNEQQFSTEHTFTCWDRIALTSISGAFTQAFLSGTDHDSDELFGLPDFELGWFRMDGGVASSTTTTVTDPAFLAVLIERVSQFGAASLPYQTGTQDNGDLLPRGVDGDS